MTDRPIIFSAPMVRALLDGRKSQTRRLATSPLAKCQPGDRLWVREAWADCSDGPNLMAAYMADHPGNPRGLGWRPSIHMPRWASRLTLTVEEARFEPLQNISEADAQAEGLYRSKPDDEDRAWFADFHEENNGEPPSEADWAQFNEGVWLIPGLRQGWGMTKAERDRDQWAPTAACGFKFLWNSLHTKPGERWEDNPEIVALTFTVARRNIDAEAA